MGLWIPGGVSDSGGGLKIVTWADGAVEDLATMLEAHYNGDIDIHDYWSIGDERVVSLSAMSAGSSYATNETHIAQDVVYVLTENGGILLSDGTTECAFQVDQKDCLKEPGRWAWESGSNQYSISARRNWCNSIYKNALPSDFVSLFKEFKNKAGYSQFGFIDNFNDYFSLRAEIEVYCSISTTNSGEGSPVEYYKTSSNRIKKCNGSNINYWTRSGISYNYVYDSTKSDTCVCLMMSDGLTYYTTYNNNNQYGIAPFGVI